MARLEYSVSPLWRKRSTTGWNLTWLCPVIPTAAAVDGLCSARVSGPASPWPLQGGEQACCVGLRAERADNVLFLSLTQHEGPGGELIQQSGSWLWLTPQLSEQVGMLTPHPECVLSPQLTEQEGMLTLQPECGLRAALGFPWYFVGVSPGNV